MLGLGPLRDAVHATESVFKDPPGHWPRAFLDRLFEVAALLRRGAEHAGSEEQDAILSRLSDIDISAPEDAPERAVDEDDEEHGEDGGDEPGAERPLEGPAAGAADEAHVESGTDVLRIPFRKLDGLMEEVGELVGLHATLGEFLNRERRTLAAAGLQRELRDHILMLGRLSDTLRSSVMELRMVPAGRIFRRFPTMARDIGRAQDKEVHVELEGEETELDKSTMDALAEPLLHLVRNAIDHGIEPPDARKAAGKPPHGTVTLAARQVGDTVRVTVADDGKGFDREAILARGRELGIVPAGGRLEDHEVDDLVFHPGFTTRSEVTDVSGRGVGLDVVRSSVQRLRGRIEVETDREEGTRFHLELPLTLAILSTLFFEASGETLGVPARDVVETLSNPPVRGVGRAPVVMHGEALVPLLHPARIFGWKNGGAPADEPAFAVVVRGRARTVALAADRLLDHRDVVVKALPETLGAPRGVSGGTVLPSGRAALLVDPSTLTELNLERTAS